MAGEPETLHEHFGANWPVRRPTSNRADPKELVPRGQAYVVRQENEGRIVEAMGWDVLGGMGKFPMTNVRQLGLPQWRRLAERPEKRCLVPLTEFCEWTPEKDPVHKIKGEMWFGVPAQPIFAVAGFWQRFDDAGHFTMVTCDPNSLVQPIHPKAMLTILRPEDWEHWLTCSYDDVVALQRPYPADLMTVRGPVFPTGEQKGFPQ
jgi:putative SOS response-associated peptidase YedK